MHPVWLLGLVAVTCLFAQPAGLADEWQAIEFEGKRWVADVNTHVVAGEFYGRQALNVRGGTHAYVFLPDVDFGNGTIEVDVAAGPRGVPGVGFRGSANGSRVDKVAFSLFRPGSQAPEGAVGQVVITPRDGTMFLLRTDRDVESPRWFRVRLDVHDGRVTVYVNGAVEPVLVVDKMLDANARGNLGVWGLQDVYFSNFRYTPAELASGRLSATADLRCRGPGRCPIEPPSGQ